MNGSNRVLFEREQRGQLEEKREAVVAGVVAVETAEKTGSEPESVEKRLIAACVQNEQGTNHVQILEVRDEVVENGGVLENVGGEDVRLVATERFYDHGETHCIAGSEERGKRYWGL